MLARVVNGVWVKNFIKKRNSSYLLTGLHFLHWGMKPFCTVLYIRVNFWFKVLSTVYVIDSSYNSSFLYQVYLFNTNCSFLTLCMIQLSTGNRANIFSTFANVEICYSHWGWRCFRKVTKKLLHFSNFSFSIIIYCVYGKV